MRPIYENDLSTPAARLAMTAYSKERWCTLDPGKLHLGYKRTHDGVPGAWTVRRYLGMDSENAGRYAKKRLPGVADDYDKADGAGILSYAQACEFANAMRDIEPKQKQASARFRLNGFRETIGTEGVTIKAAGSVDVALGCGVVFLVNKGEIILIDSTQCILAGIAKHRNLIFDGTFFVTTGPSDANVTAFVLKKFLATGEVVGGGGPMPMAIERDILEAVKGYLASVDGGVISGKIEEVLKLSDFRENNTQSASASIAPRSSTADENQATSHV